MNGARNPDSVVLQQVDQQWQKLAALILWKTVGAGVVVRITAADIEAMNRHFAPGIANVFTHGQQDALEFSLVDNAAAERIAEHDRRTRGAGHG